MSLRVLCGIDEPLEFSNAHAVLRPYTLHEATAALRDAEAALSDGYWIAGYLTYEFGAALHGVEPAGDAPLLCIGVFDAPSTPVLPDARTCTLSPLLPSIERREYDGAIAAIRQAIYDGDVYQVNYTVPFAVNATGDLETFWRATATRTGARYQALVEDGARKILSWSPELFLQFDGELVRTRPMKGTAPLDAAGDLTSGKNRAEHVMIVDLLRNDLHRIARDVTVEQLCTVERYPTFLTMTSTIAGTVNTKSLETIVRATFPCGSITGAPKRAAIQHIKRLERHARGIYCGTIGYLSPAWKGWWNVAIRTAQFDGSAGRFDAGGGIVADSNAQDEWREVLLKSTFLRENSQPLVLLETFSAAAPAETIDEHVTRMRRSATAFGMPFDEDALREALRESRLRFASGIVRLRLHASGKIEIRHDEAPIPETPVSVCVSRERVRSHDPFLRHKTAWRPAHEAAAAEAAECGAFDALLRNERDEFTEGSRTNLFAELGGTLWTPPLFCGPLPGILRSKLVSEGRARERTLQMADLLNADRLFVGNSARGLLRARLVTTNEDE